jgi:hypothetical protein
MTPTRSTIESIVTTIAQRVRVFDGSAWRVLSGLITTSCNIQGNTVENGLAFGDSFYTEATISTLSATNLPENWKNARTWIETKFQQGDWVPTFYGFITGKVRGEREIELSCGGIIEHIKLYKIYTKAFYRRPISTRTAIDIDDNPDNVNYAGGLINEIFWRAGGRPDSQRASFPSQPFYYTCDQSIILPEWIWLSGENLEDELLTLARAGGGQIYQGPTDVIRYVQPLAFAGTSSYTITDSYFSTFAETQETSMDVGTLRGVYTPRLLRGVQSVYADTMPRLIPPSGIIAVEANTANPIYVYAELTARKCVKAHAWDHIQEYPTLTLSGFYAQRIAFTLQNTLSGVRYGTMVVTNIDLQGRPITALEKGYVSFGSGTPEKELEDNPYVQSRQHANMLCRMAHDFYSPNKAIITLGDCPYDPDRYIGETVTFSSNYLSISGLCRIVGISYSDLAMELKLVDVTGVLTRNDIFIIGTSYSAGDTRRVSY